MSQTSSGGLGETAAKEVVKTAVSTATKLAIDAAVGPSGTAITSKVLGWLRLTGNGNSRHPSLDEVRTALDHLARMIPSKNGPRHGAPYSINGDDKVFKQTPMTAREVANLWFRMDTDAFRGGPGPLVNEWLRLSTDEREPYFTGQGLVSVDFTKAPKAKRHPLLRELHPFIMLTRVKRDALGTDPVERSMETFSSIWRAFVSAGALSFERGIEMKLDEQGYMEGTFKVSGWDFEAGDGTRLKCDISIWRQMLVSCVGGTLYTLNFGTPRYAGAPDLEPHFHAWMKGFRLNRT